MKLVDLYNEIKINKPLSQKEILNELIKLNNSYILEQLSENESIKDLIGGWDSIEQMLKDDYEYEDSDVKIIKNLIENYFKYFKKGDIWILSIGDNNDLQTFNLPKNYSKFTLDYDEYNEYDYIILHNINL